MSWTTMYNIVKNMQKGKVGLEEITIFHLSIDACTVNIQI